MNIIRRFRQKTAFILLLAMLVTLVPIGDWGLITARAATVGTTAAPASLPISVTGVEFIKNHTGLSVTGAILNIVGDNLTGVSVRFDLGNGFVLAGTKASDSDDENLTITLNQSEAAGFTGRVRISSTTIQLVSTSFPFISSLDKQVVNKDTPQTLELSGGGLDRINKAGENITATYGRGLSVKNIVPEPIGSATPSKLTFQPPADTLLGSQDITIKETSSMMIGTDPVPITTLVQSTYSSPFRVVKNLTLAQPQMFPNSAAKGEMISITSTDFPASSGYQVYFLGPNEDVSLVNKSPSVVLSVDRKKLTVQVPTGAIDFGSKTVKVVDTIAGEIVSEAVIPGTFNLIDGANGPIIDDIAPNTGTDTGSSVSIKGRNLLTPVFPDLVGPVTITTAAVNLSANKQDLNLVYNAGTLSYQGVPVTSATRTVKAIIGAAATFEEDSAGKPRYIAGSDDFLFVKTSPINDAATDPEKDVILEITTTIVAGGQTYVYNQTAVVTDGYTFIPSSLKPKITKISPDQIHMTSARKMKVNTLISIEGSDYMVNKWTDTNGNTHLNYPVVMIQKINTLGTGDFILMFDKNGNPANTNGRIYYKDGAGVTQILTDGTNEVPVDMVVLDANNKVVDGTVGNEIGTRIVLYLPTWAQMDAEAKRHVKVFNPKRNDDTLGSETIALDVLDFVIEPATPILESVSPTIVTADGGEDVTIIGSTSIEEGAKVYIDGKEVSGVTRSIDLTGNKVNLKFKAPKGRLGKTQLAVINPLGGIAVRDFFYVQSFNKDPLLTTVAPDKGTEGTVVVLGGDNYFKPDPSVATESGMDAFRLVGTRVLLDGLEVNQYYKGSYGEILFKPYTSPAGNNVLNIVTDAQGVKQAQLADFGNSVILKSAAGYYTLDTLFDGTIRLSNGQTNTYTIRLNATQDGFVAIQDGGSSQNITVNSTGITLAGPTALSMITPYLFDTNNVITGNHTRVVSKNQIIFTVPRLVTAGLKDVAVENPDTKRATKEKSFTYYDSPFPQPTISAIDPDKGSVTGGYLTAITGTNFETGSLVYIDGVLVPAAETTVNAAGTLITVKVPKYSRNLADYLSDRITVPVVVVNKNAGSASKLNGFTYISPSKEPALTKIQLDNGSTTGGEIVELEGDNFNYFEPFKERDGIPGYSAGDTFTNINGSLVIAGVPNMTWDDLSTLSDGNPPNALLEASPFPNAATYMFYSQYYNSPILPKVYFGTKQAQIVSYGKGRLTVLTPPNTAGVTDVYVVNNDTGVSNKLKYAYKSSNPAISYMNPTQGSRTGQDNRDIYGERFAQTLIPGYFGAADAASDAYQPQINRIEALVRFADITNRKIALGQPNDGKIGGGEQAIVTLEGGLSMRYNGATNTITVNLQENGKLYTRDFKGYDDRKLLIPAGMLKYNNTEFYVPNNYTYDSSVYNATTHYELFMVEVDEASGRFFVERGYAPRVEFDNATHLNLDTPSYYTIGQVNVTVTNPDGGTAVTKYTYRNPATKPTIQLVKPQAKILDEKAYMVEATIKGGISIEIKGHDFRDGVKVYLDKTPMEVMEITVDNTIPSDPLDVIIAKVPAGTDLNIGIRYPIIIENTDGGIANSTDPKTLTKVESDSTKWPIYFIYRKPLSDPVILTVTPAESSIYVSEHTTSDGTKAIYGNEITITGTDFRAGAMVIIGSIGGVPVTPHYIEDRGRILKFYIPPNLTVGAKDIQVINTDFGTGTKTNGLKIISYPQVTGIKAGDGANAVEWVSVEGGTKIRINGSGFDAGAKVYFGGTRAQLATGDTNAVSGLWRDNNYYAVKDSTAASAVEFVDSTALTVTVPQVFKEKEFTITVINGDTGISDGDTTIKYSVPVPSTPLNLDAEIVNNKYIKLFGYTSSNFDYFEIYTFIGNKSVAKLEDNNYKDFHYLATAQTEPYKITRMEGLDEMDDKDRVFIVLKAVNKYGPSSWSNIAYLKYSEINDIKGGLGVEDFDGNMDVPAGQAFGTAVGPQQAIVTISKTDLRNMVTIPMTDSRFTAVQKTLVNIPETVVADNYNLITMQMKQGRLRFYPAILNTVRFQQISGGDQIDSYGNLSFEPVTTDYAGLIQSYVPRGMKAYSQPYRVGAAVASNAGVTELAELAGSMEVALTYLSPLPAGTNPAALQLYWYDAASSRWVVQNSALDTLNRQIYSQVARPGIYMVMGPR